MSDHLEGIVSHVVSKCSKSSICWVLKQWGRFSDINVDEFATTKGVTKDKIAKKIAELSKEKHLHEETMGDLELVYTQLHSAKKLWKVFKLKGCQKENLNLDPRRLRAKLVTFAGRLWRTGSVTGNMKMYSGAVWLRLHFDSTSHIHRGPSGGPSGARDRQKHYKPNDSVFLIVFHNSPVVMLSQSSVKMEKLLLEMLQKVFECRRVKNLHLSGRDPMSLADIAHTGNKESVLSRYRDEERKDNPLCTSVRQPFTDLHQSVDGVTVEDRQRRLRHREEMESVLGGPQPPVLHTLRYSFDNVKYCGNPVPGNHAADSLPRLSVSVEVSGTDVLRGMCRLSELGMVRHPVPPHLYGCMEKARNEFRIKDSDD